MRKTMSMWLKRATNVLLAAFIRDQPAADKSSKPQRLTTNGTTSPVGPVFKAYYTKDSDSIVDDSLLDESFEGAAFRQVPCVPSGAESMDDGMGGRRLELVVHSVGLLRMKALLVLCLWYTFSFTSLFLNKYILDSLHVDVVLFSGLHLFVGTSLGLVNMYCPCYMYDEPAREIFSASKPVGFYRHMAVVGAIRFSVVLFGLLSLKYVAISFLETVKSSAPLFTVLISYLVLKERNGLFVLLSLLPIMFGLVLCSAYELSFTWVGFMAANGANLVEWPAEFQFYTCSGGFIVFLFSYVFFCAYSTDPYHLVEKIKVQSVIMMALNGVLFHFQTMMAWILMEFLSPVTHSVCNTVKCALAVWISVPIFGNHVTLLSGLGSFVVLIGVFLYNKAVNYEYLHRIVQMSTAAPGIVIKTSDTPPTFDTSWSSSSSRSTIIVTNTSHQNDKTDRNNLNDGSDMASNSYL